MSLSVACRILQHDGDDNRTADVHLVDCCGFNHHR
jgi:hypothetical protein